MMRLHWRTWLAIGVAAVALALLNLHCWRPGIGGRRDHQNGIRAEGTEVELYFGWPACYQAELIKSDDPTLSARLLRTAPFLPPPYSEGWVSARYHGRSAALLDVVFALAGLALTALWFECGHRKRWPGIAIVAALTFVLLLVSCYVLADKVGVHL